MSQIPVGRCTLGRIMNVIGEPIDEVGPIGEPNVSAPPVSNSLKIFNDGIADMSFSCLIFWAAGSCSSLPYIHALCWLLDRYARMQATVMDTFMSVMGCRISRFCRIHTLSPYPSGGSSFCGPEHGARDSGNRHQGMLFL